jgi:ribosomal protein S18 acetylase RimI-like enzyme
MSFLALSKQYAAYYGNAHISIGVLSLNAPALLAAVVCVPLSLYGDWIPAALCGLALLFLDRMAAVRPRLQKSVSMNIKGYSDVLASKEEHSSAALTYSPSLLCAKPFFTVSAATPDDASALAEMYERDYLQAHRSMHKKQASGATLQEWEVALGPINFHEVLSGALEGVKLLKCTAQGSTTPIGYILYEMREKGPRGKKRQRFCELVNIVVDSKHRGCGAGRLLFDALRMELASSNPAHAGDLRLFVAERNEGPLAWYRRLGFTDAGWQSESLGGSEIQFLRMMYNGGCK